MAKALMEMQRDRWAGGQLDGRTVCKMPGKLYLCRQIRGVKGRHATAKHIAFNNRKRSSMLLELICFALLLQAKNERQHFG